jgi:Xaa-Pro aminopeptidase
LVWDVVRRAQKAAFEAARPGAEAQPLEAVARRVVEEAGFVPGEIGIRHEGCIYITQDGAANMTR